VSAKPCANTGYSKPPINPPMTRSASRRRQPPHAHSYWPSHRTHGKPSGQGPGMPRCPNRHYPPKICSPRHPDKQQTTQIGRFGPMQTGTLAGHGQRVSRRGESHPPPLSGPDVTVSRHPAPTARPAVNAISCQWANRRGWC
jgi:hypothetical protein